MISADTSVLVRYLVGTPLAQARRAADRWDHTISLSPMAIAECAHVLRTQYNLAQADILDSLIGLIQRENVRVLGMRTDLLVGVLVRARQLSRRPIPDALIIAASLTADALPLATFDRGQGRYGIPVREP